MPKKVQSESQIYPDQKIESQAYPVHPYAINYQNSVHRQKSSSKLQYISAPKIDINMQ